MCHFIRVRGMSKENFNYVRTEVLFHLGLAIKCCPESNAIIDEHLYAPKINPRFFSNTHMLEIVDGEDIYEDKGTCDISDVTITEVYKHIKKCLKSKAALQKGGLLSVLIMPHIPGINGFEVLQWLTHKMRGTMSPQLQKFWLISYFISVFNCLNYIHQKRLIHGDWRPGNCMFSKFLTMKKDTLQNIEGADFYLQCEAIDAENVTPIGKALPRCFHDTAVTSYWPACCTQTSTKDPQAHPKMDWISFLRITTGSGTRARAYFAKITPFIIEIDSIKTILGCVRSNEHCIQFSLDNRLFYSRLFRERAEVAKSIATKSHTENSDLILKCLNKSS